MTETWFFAVATRMYSNVTQTSATYAADASFIWLHNLPMNNTVLLQCHTHKERKLFHMMLIVLCLSLSTFPLIRKWNHLFLFCRNLFTTITRLRGKCRGLGESEKFSFVPDGKRFAFRMWLNWLFCVYMDSDCVAIYLNYYFWFDERRRRKCSLMKDVQRLNNVKRPIYLAWRWSVMKRFY